MYTRMQSLEYDNAWLEAERDLAIRSYQYSIPWPNEILGNQDQQDLNEVELPENTTDIH